MIRIVATAEQTRQFKEADGAIEIVDEHGNRLGIIVREIDSIDVRIAKERLRSNELQLTFAEVLEHLSKLENRLP